MEDELRKAHQQFGVELFNRCWELIDQPERTGADDEEMLLAASTSLWHWSQIGGPEEIATGQWLLAHAAALAGLADLSRAFATRNLGIAEAENWGGWRLASAHEGMARACAASGDEPGRLRHVAEAEKALDSESDADDRALIEAQLASVRPAGS